MVLFLSSFSSQSILWWKRKNNKVHDSSSSRDKLEVLSCISIDVMPMSCMNQLCDDRSKLTFAKSTTVTISPINQQNIDLQELSGNQLKSKASNKLCVETKPIIPSVSVSQVRSEVGNGKLDDFCDTVSEGSETGAAPAIASNEKASSPTPTLYFSNTDDWTWSYKGILLPKLTNDFKDDHLEAAYQRYSHRQRQKSLVILNVIDILLKLGLLIIYAISDDAKQDNRLKYRILYNVPWFVINGIVICLITCWKQFANNYLHLGAVFTWIIFNVQGLSLRLITFCRFIQIVITV